MGFLGALLLMTPAACAGSGTDRGVPVGENGSETGTASTPPAGPTGTPPTGTGTVPTGTMRIEEPVPVWPTDADPSPGCANLDELYVGGTQWDIEVASTPRTYRLEVGPAVESRAPSPVILLLHGLGSDGTTVLDYSEMAASANRMGALVVLPDAVGAQRRWATTDVAFLGAVLDEVEAFHCVDRNRVWLAGLSMGGFMAARLVCDVGGRFAAVAAVAGFGYDAATCGDTPPTPVLTFHGTEDGVVPFAGRPPAYADVIPSSGAEPAVEAWAGHNGCGPVAPDEMVSPEVTRRRWTGCRAETVLYIVEGGGHSWPGAEPEPRQGYTTDEISASDVMADFFVRNVRALGP